MTSKDLSKIDFKLNNYSLSCPIRHLYNPFHCVIRRWFSFQFDHVFLHCNQTHCLFHSRFLSQCIWDKTGDKTGFTVHSRTDWYYFPLPFHSGLQCPATWIIILSFFHDSFTIFHFFIKINLIHYILEIRGHKQFKILVKTFLLLMTLYSVCLPEVMKFIILVIAFILSITVCLICVLNTQE